MPLVFRKQQTIMMLLLCQHKVLAMQDIDTVLDRGSSVQRVT